MRPVPRSPAFMVAVGWDDRGGGAGLKAGGVFDDGTGERSATHKVRCLLR